MKLHDEEKKIYGKCLQILWKLQSLTVLSPFICVHASQFTVFFVWHQRCQNMSLGILIANILLYSASSLLCSLISLNIKLTKSDILATRAMAGKERLTETIIQSVLIHLELTKPRFTLILCGKRIDPVHFLHHIQIALTLKSTVV